MAKRRLAAAAAALGLAGAMMFGAVPAMASEKEDTQPQVTVSAQGTIMEVPDMAQIIFSVSTDGEEAEATQQENTDKVNNVMETLEMLGVEKESIQTSGYSMYPKYNYDVDPAVVVGYSVRTTLTVSDQKIEDAGKILSECVNAGVNDIDGVYYTCSTYDEKYQEALTKAVKAAKVKADTLAAAAGATAGRAISIDEGYQDLSARYQASGESYDAGSMKSMAAAEDTAAAPDMNAGSLEITANVSVTYELTY